MQKVYHVLLTADERAELHTFITHGTAAARALTRARILLKADEAADGPAWSDPQIAAALDVSRPTIERVRRRFGTERIAAAQRHPPATRPAPKVDGEQEAHLIALACSAPHAVGSAGPCGCSPNATSSWDTGSRSPTSGCARP